MDTIYIVCPNKNISTTLKKMIEAITENQDFIIIDNFHDSVDLTQKKIIFALELNDLGFDIEMLIFMSKLYAKDNNALKSSHGAVIIHSSDELYTKNASQDLIYMANLMGCSFMGHPLVEATKDFINFKTWKKVLTDLPLEDICYEMCKKLRDRLIEFTFPKLKSPKILVLYSTPHKKSNTLDFWYMVKKSLSNFDIKEIQIEHGEIYDCKGCKYDTCLHFGENNACFYGGLMVSEVLPAIEESDVVVWLCPNYNDALAANLTAVINRLTVLYRKTSFHNKLIFSVIVSGNSGSDSIAKQILGALNLNKGFVLPAEFSIHATANDPRAIFDVPDIEKRASTFGQHILSLLG